MAQMFMDGFASATQGSRRVSAPEPFELTRMQRYSSRLNSESGAIAKLLRTTFRGLEPRPQADFGKIFDPLEQEGAPREQLCTS